jgi:hypothetical protein
MPERAARHEEADPVRRPEARRSEPPVGPVLRSGLRVPAQLVALQRAAGNRAVTGVIVQRHAFVGGVQVATDDATLDPAMRAFAADTLIRDYNDRAEFQAHAAGGTDYLGNLPGPASTGTWVRFDPAGTNLLGENHTQVTLEHVVRAVGTTSFVYEPFSVDTMPAGSRMRTAYETENAQRFQDFGVAGAADKRQFGGESLFPKMGYGLNLLIPYLAGNQPLNGLKSGGYVGQPVQRYLKIAWGHSTDVAAQVARAKLPWQRPSKELRALAREYNAVRGTLDGFITALPVDGFLGDALDNPAGLALLPPMLRFCRAFVAAMLAQAGTDKGITKAERKSLKRMPRGDQDEKEEVFGKWRNLHFAHATADAVRRGVRYAGMGNDHLRYLRGEGLPANSHPYDMTGSSIVQFETRTLALRGKLKPP